MREYRVVVEVFLVGEGGEEVALARAGSTGGGEDLADAWGILTKRMGDAWTRAGEFAAIAEEDL